MKILIVDDREENLYLLESLLKGSGYEVTSARNGVEALESLKRDSMDMIISDILMPMMDGFQLCRECKRDDTLRKIPFVFYTATYTDKKDEALALSLGADRFVAKPMEPERFMEIVESTLRDHKKGLLTPSEIPVEEEEAVYLKVYNERLVKMLEKKMLDLEQANKALRESEERFRQFFENEPDYCYMISPEGTILDVNAAALEVLGYEKVDLLGRPLETVYAPESLPKLKHLFAKWQETGELKDEEMIIVAKEGSRRDVLLSVGAVRDRDGEILHSISVQRDITERKKLEEQLRHSKKVEAVGRLAGGVAHDFNNLLTVILFYAESLQESLDDEEVKADLKEIYNAGKRAADLTRQLLAFSRKQVIKPIKLQINDVISDMMKMLRRLIREDIGLEVRLSDNVLTIKADPGQIEQVLVNSVVNAQDAIRELGDPKAEKRITISTKAVYLDDDFVRSHPGAKKGDYCGILIGDTGIGMSDEVRERAFEPFFTTKEVGKGTGLGLATIYGIVKQNDGYIDIVSAPGKGTTFHIYWPLQKVADIEEGEKTEKKEFRAKATVLFVEDDSNVRQVGVSILKALGLNYIDAKNGVDALEKTEALDHPIDLLITDVVMPKMDGRTLAEELQKRFSQLKVIFTSGYTSDLIARHGIIEEGLAFVSKPYNKESLGGKIQEVLSEGKRSDETGP